MNIFSPIFAIFFLLNDDRIEKWTWRVDGTISQNFREFVQSRYGVNVANLLARDDLGSVGSYGGGDHVAGEKTAHLPVIFVHGLLTSAGTTQFISAFFQANGGYSEEELYATTYGPRGSLVLSGALECLYSQALRYLIIAVSEFTDSAVNIIAYSTGVPIVRKAILGGRCVEGGELGRGALTRYVNTFLGVAGPNNGLVGCSSSQFSPSGNPFVPSLANQQQLALTTGTCNLVNGLRCNSLFLRDVNARQHYEGQTIYVIQSTGDLTVGGIVCGVQTTAIPGADYTLTFDGLSHIQVITLTVQQQFNLVTKHSIN